MLIVAGVVALLMVVTVAGGGAFLLLSNRTETLTMNEYAERMCNEVLKPWSEDLEDLGEEDEWRELRDLDDLSSTDDARKFLQFMSELMDQAEGLSDGLEGFDKDFRLAGSDGEDLHEALIAATESSRERLEDVREFLSDADPSEGEKILATMDEFNLEGSSVKVSDFEIGAGLNEKLAEVDDECVV